jgi:hypothetical protein
VYRLMQFFRKQAPPVGPEVLIQRECEEVVLAWERTFNWHDIGQGVWCPKKGSVDEWLKSTTIEWAFKAHSPLAIQLTLKAVINGKGDKTALSWTYASPDLESDEVRTLIACTDKMIEELLAGAGA